MVGKQKKQETRKEAGKNCRKIEKSAGNYCKEVADALRGIAKHFATGGAYNAEKHMATCQVLYRVCLKWN